MAYALKRPVTYEIEPLLESRFFVQFPSDVGIEEWKVMTAKLPTVSNEVIEVPYLNNYQYTIGHTRWEQMDITFIDTIGASTRQQLIEWMRLHHESLTGRSGYNVGFKKDFFLLAADPAGVPIARWLIRKALIANIDFGNNDYGSDEIIQPTLTIQPEDCILEF